MIEVTLLFEDEVQIDAARQFIHRGVQAMQEDISKSRRHNLVWFPDSVEEYYNRGKYVMLAGSSMEVQLAQRSNRKQA